MPLYLKAIPPKPSYVALPTPDLSPIPAENIAILYLILVHCHPELVMRLIDALSESQHTFVVHVDLKFPDVRTKLSTFAAGRENVFILEDGNSVSVTWGGFSVVNATIQGMKYAWLLERPFDYLQLLSGTSYPIKSNYAIRTELSQQPRGIYMDVPDEPSLPHESMWFHYVECDDRLHRIHRMSIIRGKL